MGQTDRGRETKTDLQRHNDEDVLRERETNRDTLTETACLKHNTE